MTPDTQNTKIRSCNLLFFRPPPFQHPWPLPSACLGHIPRVSLLRGARRIVYQSRPRLSAQRARPGTLPMNQDLRRPLNAWRLAVLSLLAACLTTAVSGCSELRGRRRIREGNRLYREGNYAEALQEFKAAEPFVPQLPQVWRGEGLACRQMMAPGAKSAENDHAVDCALTAFDRLRQLGRGDAAGEALYIQTLFDGDRFETLANLFQERLRKDPSDLAAVNGL